MNHNASNLKTIVKEIADEMAERTDRGEVATPILKLRPVVPSEEEQARMLQSEDLGRTIAFVASMPPRGCMNEILISPTWKRGFIQTPHSRD